MRSFPDLVQMGMRRRGLTQAQVARSIGVRQGTFAGWLTRRRPVPAARWLSLAEVLHLRGSLRAELLVAMWLTAAPSPLADVVDHLVGHTSSRVLIAAVRRASAHHMRDKRIAAATDR